MVLGCSARGWDSTRAQPAELVEDPVARRAPAKCAVVVVVREVKIPKLAAAVVEAGQRVAERSRVRA